MSKWQDDFYSQNNKISGKINKDGSLELYDLVDWEERKNLRTDGKGNLRSTTDEKKKEPVLVQAPERKELSRGDYRKEVASYAKEFRQHANRTKQNI